MRVVAWRVVMVGNGQGENSRSIGIVAVMIDSISVVTGPLLSHSEDP